MTTIAHKYHSNNTEAYLYESFQNNFNNNTQNNFMSVASLSANTLGTETLDINTFDPNADHPRRDLGINRSEYTNIFIFGECGMTSATDTIAVFVSHNDTDYYKLITLQPTPHNLTTAPTTSAQAYQFVFKGPFPCRYVKIANTSGNTITNLKVHIAFMKK